MSSPPIHDQRRVNRRTVKSGTALTCTKGGLGLGPDLALSIEDFSEDGARLLLKAELAKGEEVELSFTPPGISKPTVIQAVVAWCSKEMTGYRVGVTFRSTLSYQALTNLV